MDKKEVYQEKWDAQLNQIRAKIDELSAKADKSKADAKLHYVEGIEALKSKQEDVKEKLKELKTAGGEISEDIKSQIESTLYDLKQAVENALSQS